MRSPIKSRRGPSTYTFLSMASLLTHLSNSIPNQKFNIESLWLSAWIHPDGIGLEQVIQNLRLAIQERLEDSSQTNPKTVATDDRLHGWSSAINAILDELHNNTNKYYAGVTGTSGAQRVHPISGYGLTSHGIYAGCWNLHGSFGGTDLVKAEVLGRALRKLQLRCVEAQSEVIELAKVSVESYQKWMQSLLIKNNKKAKADFFQDKYRVNTYEAGMALRLLSENEDNDLLRLVDKYLTNDPSKKLSPLVQLLSDWRVWKHKDTSINNNRENILKLLVSFVHGLGRFRRRRRPKKTQNQNKKGSDGTRETVHGYLGKWPDYIHPTEKPADLPEIEGWIDSGDVIYVDELDSGDFLDEPELTGLTSYDPENLKVGMAKARAQQHYKEMLRQCFLWDDANLTEAESRFLGRKLQKLLEEANAAEPHSDWEWEAMVLVGWLFGRDFGDVIQLKFGNLNGINGESFSLTVVGPSVEWNLPLRVSGSMSEGYTGCLERVSSISIVDQTGLGAALQRWVERVGCKQGDFVFGHAMPPELKIQHAKRVLERWSSEFSQRERLIPGRLERALLIQLMNLVPDRTIAWMLAGKPSDRGQPRMFYAVHAEPELVGWMQTAQAALVDQTWNALAPQELQTLVANPKMTVASVYVGARFFPRWDLLLELVGKARLSAQRFPPSTFHDPCPQTENNSIPFVVSEFAGERHMEEATADTAACADFKNTNPPNWNDRLTWCVWHDAVVFWVWLVQSLQTGIRAIQAPDALYRQWLEDPKRDWVSLEDKVTRDRDEARAAWVSPALNEAFLTLTATQEAFCRRCPTSNETNANIGSELPFGMVAFGGQRTPQVVIPTWTLDKVEELICTKWTENFPRSLLRRILYEAGLRSDDLDAFMGHGWLAGRVHDQHSMFDPMAYLKILEGALNKFAKDAGIERLNHRIFLKIDTPRFHIHAKKAIAAILLRKKERSKGKKTKDSSSEEFKQWCDAVQALTEDPIEFLAPLEDWYNLLLANAGDPYIARFTQLQSNTSGPGSFDKSQAAEAQRILLLPLTRREMSTAIAGNGLNLCYRISKALDKTCPTMNVFMRPAARMSPYTHERIAKANLAQKQLRALQLSLAGSDSQSEQGIESTRNREVAVRGLSAFLNVAVSSQRFTAQTQAPDANVAGKTALLQAPVALPYDYRLKGNRGQVRFLRGHTDSLVGFSPFVPQLSVEQSADDIYKNVKKTLKGQADMPSTLSAWTESIRWWARLHLPPLLVEHAAGVLDDQCSSGPLQEQLKYPQVGTAGSMPHTDWTEQEVHPRFVAGIRWLLKQPAEQFVWLTESDRSKGPVACWLDAYLVMSLGVRPVSSDSVDVPLMDLDRVLYEALLEVPSGHRKDARDLARKVRKRYDIKPEDSDYPDGVDREVVDWDSFEKVMSSLEHRCVASRNVERTKRLRMLLVLAFRLGLRRREILGLRRVDIELDGRGCVHVREWFDRKLKTTFSKRSLPIAALMPEKERQWLRELCETTLNPEQPLFPEHEHDTLSRDAIKCLRQACGNNDLKIHHLRHSFASLLLLKLALARHPEWLSAFQQWPKLQFELSQSPKLIGTLIKPWDTTGDLLAITRLMGHSSYQVTLTNYLHTIDIVLALYQANVLRDRVVPARLQGLALKSRFGTARNLLAMQDNAGLTRAALPGDASPDPQAQTGEHTVAIRQLFSERISQWLTAWFEQTKEGASSANELQSYGLTPTDISNWLEPRQATGLKELLLKLADEMPEVDLKRLVQLGQRYWQSNPPMFWLSPSKAAPQPLSIDQVVDEGQELLTLLCRTVPADSVVFCRYANSDPVLHANIWAPVMSLLGHDQVHWTRSGRAKASDALGVSIAVGKVRCSIITGVWLAGCAGVLQDGQI